MINFDKNEIKKQITTEQVFELLLDWNGEPEYKPFGIVAKTICHNPIGEGSHKLYFYSESQLFYCYTGGCAEPSFDVFELAIKVAKIQEGKTLDLNDAVRALAYRFGYLDFIEDQQEEKLEDWKVFNRYDRINSIKIKDYDIVLKEYDKSILNKFNYNVRLEPWLNDNIKQEILEKAQIGFYPGGDQITIPHFDKDGRLVGIRGRALCQEEAERFGKYRPLKINGEYYSHPLGMNLYNFNNSKDNIKKMGKAIVFESEKSTLQMQGYLGADNDMSVAVCGSNITAYQMHMLITAGAKEVCVAFDHQFKKLGDEEYIKQVKLFKKLQERYKNYVQLSFICDKAGITRYKASPSDEGLEKFLKLFKERIIL